MAAELKPAGAEPLSERREAFCRLVVSGVEPADAVVRAGSTSKEPATIASKLMRAPDILARITHLQREVADEALMSTKNVEEQKDRIIDELAAIAFSDITEILDFGPLVNIGPTPDEAFDPEEPNKTLSSGAYLRLHKSHEVDTRAIKSVEIGKDGRFKVQLYDKLRAQQQLAQILGIVQKQETGETTMEEIIMQRERDINTLRETITSRRITKTSSGQ